MGFELEEDMCSWCNAHKIEGQNMLCPECQTKLLRLVRGTTCKKCKKSIYDNRTYGTSWFCGCCINDHIHSRLKETAKLHTEWLSDILKKIESHV